MQDDFDVFAEQYIKSYRQRYGHASDYEQKLHDDFVKMYPADKKERQTKCRSCGEPIIWKPYPTTGKLHPFNPDGTSHFGTCPQAKSWRRKKKTAVPEQQLSLW